MMIGVAVLTASVVATACNASSTPTARSAAVARSLHATSTEQISTPTGTTLAPNPSSITLQEYTRVHDGMTLDRVAAILGSAGTLDRRWDHGRIDGRRWDGPPGSRGFALLFFRHEKVWAKTQVDLS
jgi:hypothetical protein